MKASDLCGIGALKSDQHHVSKAVSMKLRQHFQIRDELLTLSSVELTAKGLQTLIDLFVEFRCLVGCLFAQFQ